MWWHSIRRLFFFWSPPGAGRIDETTRSGPSGLVRMPARYHYCDPEPLRGEIGMARLYRGVSRLIVPKHQKTKLNYAFDENKWESYSCGVDKCRRR